MKKAYYFFKEETFEKCAAIVDAIETERFRYIGNGHNSLLGESIYKPTKPIRKTNRKYKAGTAKSKKYGNNNK